MRAVLFGVLAFAIGAGTDAGAACDRPQADRRRLHDALGRHTEADGAGAPPAAAHDRRAHEGRQAPLPSRRHPVLQMRAGAGTRRRCRPIATWRCRPRAFPADATAPRGINPMNLVTLGVDSDFMDLEGDHILNFGF